MTPTTQSLVSPDRHKRQARLLTNIFRQLLRDDSLQNASTTRSDGKGLEPRHAVVKVLPHRQVEAEVLVAANVVNHVGRDDGQGPVLALDEEGHAGVLAAALLHHLERVAEEVVPVAVLLDQGEGQLLAAAAAKQELAQEERGDGDGEPQAQQRRPLKHAAHQRLLRPGVGR